MTETVDPRPVADRARPAVDLDVLDAVQRRVLWLATDRRQRQPGAAER